MCADFLELSGPTDIGGFIEARTQFDQGRYLLAIVGRFDQRLDDGRITARAIKRDLDREHLRIGRCALDKPDDGIEAFVRMVEQNVLFSHDFEEVGMGRQGRVDGGLERAVL